MDQKLSEKRKTGAEYFAIEKCDMDCKDDKGKNVRKFLPVFYCKDVIGLFKFVSQRRGYHSQTDLIQLFGCDKGGKILPSLKRTVNIKKVVSEFSSPHHRRIKRSSYQDGAFPQSFLDSGVNRTIIIALAPYALETYNNMYQMTKLLNFSYTSLSNPFDTNDLLYSPMFCGVGTARSTYPCHICIMPSKDFGKVEGELMVSTIFSQCFHNIQPSAIGKCVANVCMY